MGELESMLDFELEQKIFVHKIMEATAMYSVFDKRVDDRLAMIDVAAGRRGM